MWKKASKPTLVTWDDKYNARSVSNKTELAQLLEPPQEKEWCENLLGRWDGYVVLNWEDKTEEWDSALVSPTTISLEHTVPASTSAMTQVSAPGALRVKSGLPRPPVFGRC